MVKLDIYRKFTNALAVAVLVSVGWICYEVTQLPLLVHFNVRNFTISYAWEEINLVLDHILKLLMLVLLLRLFIILWCVLLVVKNLVIVFVQLYFKSTDVYNGRWQSAWIIPAFWHVLSFSLLCVICALWAPSQNSMR